MTVFRDATPADLPAIDAVFRQSFCDTFAHLYSEANLRTFLDKFTAEAWAGEYHGAGYRFRVAEVDGEVVAFVKLGPSTLPVDTDKKAIELRQLYVLKAHHGSGIAVALTDWALATARQNGFEEVYLTVFTDNHRARRFYERYGFVYVAPYAFMVGDHEDEDIIMRLDL